MKKQIVMIIILILALVSCKQSKEVSFDYDSYIVFEEEFQNESRRQFNLDEVKDLEDGGVFYLVLVKVNDGLVEEVIEEIRYFLNMDLDNRRDQMKVYYDAEETFKTNKHIRINIEEVQQSIIVRTTYFMDEVGEIINIEDSDDMDPLLYLVRESYSDGQVLYSDFVEKLRSESFIEVELNASY